MSRRVGVRGTGGAVVPSTVQSAKSAVVRVATGVTTELIPAPPAGWLTEILAVRVINESTTATFEWSIQDALGLLYAGQGTAALASSGAGAFPLAAANVASSSFIPQLAASAVSGSVAAGGGGTPGVFIVLYTYLPIATLIKSTFLVLTTSYQAVDASCIPSAGQIALQFPELLMNGGMPSLLNSHGAYLNNDATAANIQFRHTRGSIVTVFTQAASARTKSQMTSLMPIENGDQLELKLGAAPGVAGSITVRLWYTFAPLAA